MARTSDDTEEHIVIYEYHASRKHEIPKIFLEDFDGFLHADGYEAYHNLGSDITVVGCFAHARRKFVEALKNISEDKRKDSYTKKCFILINKLFSLEQEFKNLSPEQRYEERLKQSVPIADQLF